MMQRLPKDLKSIEARLLRIEKDLSRALLCELKNQPHNIDKENLKSELYTLVAASYLSRLFTRIKELPEEKLPLLTQEGDHEERRLYETFRDILINHTKEGEDKEKTNSLRVAYISEVINVTPDQLIALTESPQGLLEESND